MVPYTRSTAGGGGGGGGGGGCGSIATIIVCCCAAVALVFEGAMKVLVLPEATSESKCTRPSISGTGLACCLSPNST